MSVSVFSIKFKSVVFFGLWFLNGGCDALFIKGCIDNVCKKIINFLIIIFNLFKISYSKTKKLLYLRVSINFWLIVLGRPSHPCPIETLKKFGLNNSEANLFTWWSNNYLNYLGLACKIN